MRKLLFSSLLAMSMLNFCLNVAKAQTDDKIYNFVSLKNPPTYPGGMSEYYKFLAANIKYPAAAVKENIKGKVLVSFVVREDGYLTDIKVERGLGYGTDEEAVRVVKLGKKWNPGKTDDGKAVKVKYNIPISFNLAGGKVASSAASTTTNSNTNTSSAAINGDKTVYNFVSMENPPTYPGGTDQLYKFLGDNIKYPKEAIKENVKGKVLVSFTVMKDGYLNDIKVDRKLGYGTDEEAIRVLKLSKRWNPGLLNGKPVNVKYNIPISFDMKK